MATIEDEFAKLVPEYIKVLHASIFEGKKMPDKYYQRTHHGYHTCLVGLVRRMLGMPKFFASTEGEEKKNYCEICVLQARGIAYAERYKDKDKYLNTLTSFKEHLKKEHGLRLEKL